MGDLNGLGDLFSKDMTDDEQIFIHQFARTESFLSYKQSVIDRFLGKF